MVFAGHKAYLAMESRCMLIVRRSDYTDLSSLLDGCFEDARFCRFHWD